MVVVDTSTKRGMRLPIGEEPTLSVRIGKRKGNTIGLQERAPGSKDPRMELIRRESLEREWHRKRKKTNTAN